MKNLALLLILFTATLYAQDSFKITGKLDGFNDGAIVRITKDNLVLDSCKLSNKNFTLKGRLQNAPSGVYLQVKDGSAFKYSFLFMGNEKIIINADSNEFPFDVKTQGSKYDPKRYELVQKQKHLQLERDKLLQEMFSLRDQNKWNDSLQKAYWSREEPRGKIVELDYKDQEMQKGFIKDNINSYYALFLLDQLKTQIDNKEIVTLLSKLRPEFKNSLYASSLNSHLKYPDLQVGQNFYNFSAITSDNKKKQFADYFAGNNYVLLDFSTIYCGFCHAAIPQLEKLKKEHNNLQVVTFYVDSDEKGLWQLRNKHTEEWNMLRDKDGRLSETYAKYKVYGTPTFYLFKPDGSLVKKFDGLTEELEQEVSDIIR